MISNTIIYKKTARNRLLLNLKVTIKTLEINSFIVVSAIHNSAIIIVSNKAMSQSSVEINQGKQPSDVLIIEL